MNKRTLEPEAVMPRDEVAAYDRLVRKYFRILHAGFIETVINQSPPRGLFLDVGTGTGWNAIGVARHNPDAQVIGVDLSDAMLSVAQENAQREGVDKRISFLKGDAKSLPFGDGIFDAVFSHNMLHHIPDPLLLLNEMARVAKHNGAVILRDLKRLSDFMTFLHVSILGLPYNRLMKKEYRDSILASLSEEEWEHLLAASKLREGHITRQFITHISIEKPATDRRQDYVRVPTPFYLEPFKKFYVSVAH